MACALTKATSRRRLQSDNQFARKSRGRRRDVSGSRGDVSETSSQLRGRLRQLRPYLIGLETRWRLESPLVAETSPRRLLETSRVSGESREIQTCSIFGETFSSLQQVSETSPRRLRNINNSNDNEIPLQNRTIKL